MVELNGCVEIVRWTKRTAKDVNVPHKGINDTYTECLYQPAGGSMELLISLGDFVRIAVEDCEGDIARVISMYQRPSKIEPYRAKVEWFSYFSSIPKSKHPSDVQPIELFLDNRYNGDVSIDSILAKCHVSSDQVTANQSNGYLCRYQMIGKCEFVLYQIKPITETNKTENDENTPKKSVHISSRKSTTKKYSHSTRSKGVLREDNLIHQMKRLSVTLKPLKLDGDIVRYDDSDTDESPSKRSKKNGESSSDSVNHSSDAKVSPIKLIKKSGQRYECQKSHVKKMNVDDDEHPKEADNLVQKSRNICRNLNLDANFLKDMSKPMKRMSMRSVRKSIKGTSSSSNEDLTKENEMKTNHLPISRTARRTLTQHDIYSTPKKNLKKTTGTPKSILKTPGTQTIGTPKRRLMISEKMENMTPTRVLRTRSQSTYQQATIIESIDHNDDDDDYKPTTTRTPKRQTSTLKTPQKSTNIAAKVKSKRITEYEKLKTPVRSSAIKERTSEIQLARERLQVSEVPNSLPCRENEYSIIYSFIEGKIVEHSGGCIYISGVPGTGKTATVTSVIRALRQEANAKNIPDFEFVELNAMRLTEPRRAYVQIYHELVGKTLPWEEARTLLEHRFTNQNVRRKMTTVLLVDELDILCNRRQDVVYNLLDWPTKKSAQLVVVTIANTMDLPERLLMGKVASRLGLTRLTFQPYTFSQLQHVITARLTGTNSYKNEAVQLVARKVASVSGDCRRALDICRRAGEIAEETCDNPVNACVSMKNVQQALEEMMASPKIRAIKSCSLMEQIFLRAIVAEVMRTGIEEVTFFGVYTQLEAIAAVFNVPLLPPGQMLLISCRLGSSRLIICEHARTDIFQKICLNVSVDDVHYALNAKFD